MRNNKIWTIIKHEYVNKITAKGFIISTILAPVGMVLIFLIPMAITYFTMTSTSDKETVFINDESGLIVSQIIEIDADKYAKTKEPIEKLKQKILDNEITAAIIFTENSVEEGKAKILVSEGTGLASINGIRSDVNTVMKNLRLNTAGVDRETINFVNSTVDFETIKVTAKGAIKDDSEIMSILSYVFAFVMYILMFLYGSQVLMGVIEEKTNRIIEVLASSVTPFQIMFGKVVGIGAVGLTQVILWILLGSGLVFVLGLFVSGAISTDVLMDTMNANPTANSDIAGMLESFDMPNISLWYVIGFIFYFLSGYFIFSTLFAAAGATVDQMQDANSMTAPLSTLIIIPILLIPNITLNPEGTLAIATSLFPFFSPILMMARIVTISVPTWQIVLSVLLQIGTFLLCLKFAAKIYRVGMLRYGKKASFKEIINWISSRNG